MRQERGGASGIIRRGSAAALIISLSGCATLMTEKTQTVRLTTDPPGQTVFYQDRRIRDGEYVNVRREFRAPAFEIREGERQAQASMAYTAEPWIIGDAGLLLFFIVPGVVAGGLDMGTGAWRKLSDPQVIHIEEALEAAEAKAALDREPSSMEEGAPDVNSTPKATPKAPVPADVAPKPAKKPVSIKSSTAASRRPQPEEGIVSWYDHKEAGHRTASGAVFDSNAMTAAHPTLPFGTVVRVTRLDTNYSVVVTVNDRGPFVKGRIIDLTRRPAEKLGLPDVGIAPCRVEVIEMPE